MNQYKTIASRQWIQSNSIKKHNVYKVSGIIKDVLKNINALMDIEVSHLKRIIQSLISERFVSQNIKYTVDRNDITVYSSNEPICLITASKSLRHKKIDNMIFAMMRGEEVKFIYLGKYDSGYIKNALKTRYIRYPEIVKRMETSLSIYNLAKNKKYRNSKASKFIKGIEKFDSVYNNLDGG